MSFNTRTHRRERLLACLPLNFLSLQDRIAEDSTPTPEQLAQEKEALKDEHVLVVLGALHAQLKALWAFKVCVGVGAAFALGLGG